MPEFQPRNFMLLPTADCQASCRYCFGPNQGGIMRCTGQAVDFITQIAPRDGRLNLTFHGGEPLLAEKGYYEYILPLLRERFGLRLQLSLQSNLWALTSEMIELIRKYDIRIGASLDGFREMCDAQCGEEYFVKTMDGIRRLRQSGITPHCICTFTPAFAGRAREVFEFFARERIPYSVHGAVRTLGHPPGKLTVSTDEMTGLLLDTFEAYRSRPGSNRVGIIDAMARDCLERKGRVCTFFNCLGKFAAIAPDGGIYACQRFCGQEEYALGNVRDLPSETDLVNSTAFRRLAEKQRKAGAACGDCPHGAYCSGGCLYNMLAEDSVKDPYCPAYQAVFNRFSREMALEMGGLMTGRLSPEKAPVLAMAGDLPHPFDREENRIKRKWALKWGQKQAPDYIYQERLNKLFLHITSNYPPGCAYIYTGGGERKSQGMTEIPRITKIVGTTEIAGTTGMIQMPEIPTQDVWDAVQEARQNGFHTVVIGGGEPLLHGDIENVLAALGEVDLKGMGLSLHTSLGLEMRLERLAVLGEVFSEIMVSINGDKNSHDTRHGRGAYEETVANLQLLHELGYINKVRLCTALDESLGEGSETTDVYALCKRLGIERVRLRPLLHPGRMGHVPSSVGIPNLPNLPNANSSNPSNRSNSPIIPGEGDFLCGREDDTGGSFFARYTCGLGQNLYIGPDGGAYPCAAWRRPDKLLGNIRDGLESILQKEVFKDLSRHHVDTNKKCKACRVRYLCGGMCKAWVWDKGNPDSGEFDCSARKAALLRQVERL